MSVVVTDNKIIIKNDKSFNLKDTLECGQFFRYKQIDGGYEVFETDYKIILLQKGDEIEIITKNPKRHFNFFDLDKDYESLKQKYNGYSDLIDKAIAFGSGIRILKQSPLEALISFIISANNNIPRIQKTIEGICREFGENKGDYFAFPTLDNLSLITVEDFEKLGAGYRSIQLVKTIKMLCDGFNLVGLKKLPTLNAREKLLTLCGVGPKVADCVLLFSLDKTDVFPVDTWIKKIYKENFYGTEDDIVKISKFFTDLFKEDSGIIQQYLFNYKRNCKEAQNATI